MTPPRRTLPPLAIVWILSWSVLSCVFLGATINEMVNPEPNSAGIIGGLAAAMLTESLAIARVVAGRRRPQAVAPPRRKAALPGTKSAARAPMRRLAGAETALRDLLRQLRDAPVPGDVVDAARDTAADTAERLRALAAKVEAVEAAVAHAPAELRAELQDGTRTLLAQLEHGLDGYGELVAAAGRLVLADSANPVPDGLVDATDRLAGFAAALRDLPRGQ